MTSIKQPTSINSQEATEESVAFLFGEDGLKPKYGSDYMLRDLAMGFHVNAPVLVIDEEEETIVTLQMLGVPQAVNANWAALMGGGKKHFILTALVALKGAKNHVKLDKVLPESGWKEMWLIHKQASFNDAEPGKSFFYLLQPSDNAMLLQNFIGLLDKSCNVPVQNDWAWYLFAKGRQEELIRPLPTNHCVGRIGFKVLTSGWDEIIAEGIKNKHISF